jgi:murein DD-endopeptidase MepM/ murein hydrolase activator NlpD
LNRRKTPKKKKIFLLVIFVVLIASFSLHQPLINLFKDKTPPVEQIPSFKSISSTIEYGDTLFSIFIENGLRTEDLFAMKSAAASVHPLRELHPGKAYSIVLDEQNCINSFTYGIDDATILKIERVENEFQASKYNIPYETRILTIRGTIEDNLISAVGTEKENYLLALQVADILAWDIDFNTDLRTGDTFRIITEGLYLNGDFKKYGKILAVEFINNNQAYRAFLFEHSDKTDYYDAAGNSLRKAFLKAPLSFRRISSHFSKRRFHPVLKIYRPHHGIDYAAATGTPVSTVGDGKVIFSGYKGGYGKLIIISHSNGFKTYYGHLSRFAKGIYRGKRVKQGDLIGYVGKTGLATGPHLHYEMRQHNRPINPFRVKNVAGKPVPKTQRAEFKKQSIVLDKIFAAAIFYDARQNESKKYCLNPEIIAESCNFSKITKPQSSKYPKS